MEIRDYILNEKELEKLKNSKVGQKKERIKRADYQVLFQSGSDFGIEKKMGKKTSRLVILVSKEQYYISEGNTVKGLTVSLLRNFLKEVENGIPLPEVYWLWGLCNDQGMPGRFIKILRNIEIHEMLKKGTIYVYSDAEINAHRAQNLNDSFHLVDMNNHEWRYLLGRHREDEFLVNEYYVSIHEETGLCYWSLDLFGKKRR